MRLKIAGIHHFDVLGRTRLLAWLLERRESEKGRPEFVAVEFDEQIFERIRAQRSLIRSLAAERWPFAPASAIEILGSSLGYEGDLHDLVFPGVTTVWLDADRVVDALLVDNYAADRLARYREFAARNNANLSDDMLAEMSTKAWMFGGPPAPGGDKRDEQFANSLLERCADRVGGWGVVIVGENHASEVAGSMLSRLRGAGVNTERWCLRPGG